MTTDSFGDRMKIYEAFETDRYFLPLLPIYARIDGRSFSKFTKGMERPYDVKMSETMVEVTKFLVDETHALIGYTQSDEISLCWYTTDPEKEMFFNRRIFKIATALAGLASTKFTLLGLKHWPEKVEKLTPTFDCRVYQLPNATELANAFLWREQDATKNAISMAAQAYYSHKELDHKNGSQKQEMLFQKGINFNDYPAFFKRGTFVRRETYETILDEETWLKIPEAKRPARDTKVVRSRVVSLDMPFFSGVANRVDVICNGAIPEEKVLAETPEESANAAKG